MNDFRELKEELPSKEKFCSSLTNRTINDEELEHVLNVWNKFEMKSITDYHNLNLKWDVLFLAKVFEKFRNNSFKNYGLSSSHYLSAPGLSWDAMLQMTKIKFELIPDPDMFTTFEKGRKCRISCISDRYSKASNKYLKSDDPKQESKHRYSDINNLYGYAMLKFLPTWTHLFKWIDSLIV